jgi:hypothetical protein
MEEGNMGRRRNRQRTLAESTTERNGNGKGKWQRAHLKMAKINEEKKDQEANNINERLKHVDEGREGEVRIGTKNKRGRRKEDGGWRRRGSY